VRIYEHTGGGRIFSVVPSGKGMQNYFFARRSQFEQDSGVEIAALRGRAVEIAGRVQRQASARTYAIRASREVVQHGFVAAGVYFENDAGADRAALRSGAIKIACIIANQRSNGKIPVRPASKAVQHGFVAQRIDLVDSTRVGGAAVTDGAVEIAAGIADHTCIGIAAVRCTAEVVKHAEGLRLGELRGYKSEHYEQQKRRAHPCRENLTKNAIARAFFHLCNSSG